MSHQMSITKRVTVGGKTFTVADFVSDEGLLQRDSLVTAAKSGQLTTRTDNDTGTLTMETGHGIITGDKIDLYWTEGGVSGSRHQVTVGTVSVNSVPIDLGAGDNLPLVNTAIIAKVPEQDSLLLVGDNCKGFVVDSEEEGQITLTQSGGTIDFNKPLRELNSDSSGFFYAWYNGEGPVNPLATKNSIAKIFLSHRDVSASRRMKVAILLA